MNIKEKINRKEVIQVLSDMVSINSVNSALMPDAPGEAKVAEYIAQFFTSLNIKHHYQEVYPGRSNIIGTIPGKDPKKHLVFESHMDVVSTKGMTIPPFQPKIDGNRMYGRGTCDTKSSMAGMLCAIKAILETGEQPSCTVTIVGAVDEEHLYRGVVKLVDANMGFTAGVVGEPTELNIVRAHKGCVRWRIIVTGRAAHTSKPQLGVNAIVKMGNVIRAIEERLQPQYKAKTHPLVGNPTLTISMIQGGTQVNFVPDECSITLDRRVIPGEDKDTVWKEFDSILDFVRKQDPDLKVHMEEPYAADWAMETEEHENIVQVGFKSAQDTLKSLRITGVPYGTDASKLVRSGVPCIVLGPGSIDQAHTADEWVDLDQVVLCTEIYARIMMSY